MIGKPHTYSPSALSFQQGGQPASQQSDDDKKEAELRKTLQELKANLQTKIDRHDKFSQVLSKVQNALETPHPSEEKIARILAQKISVKQTA